MTAFPIPALPVRGARRLVLVGATLVAFALAGCSLTRPAPVKRTFLLEPPAPPAVATAKPATLRIGTFSVGEPFRDRSFVYRTSELGFETDFYDEFFVAPAPMIASATQRALASANVFARVVPGSSVPDDGDFVIEGFVSELYADTRRSPSEAVIAITFFVSRTAFPSTVVWSKAYAQRVPVAGTTPDALAAAWNAALGNVLAELARDLAAADLAKK
jgi:cholesterol transport system auxiliary component